MLGQLAVHACERISRELQAFRPSGEHTAAPAFPGFAGTLITTASMGEPSGDRTAHHGR